MQPPLAIALGLLTLALRPLGGRVGWLWARVRPRSIGGQLRLAFGALTVLALVLGMVGFGIIEEMHIRNRRVQLRADWQRQLGTIRATLDEERVARGDFSPSGGAGAAGTLPAGRVNERDDDRSRPTPGG